jgi:hypothetical protein
MKILCGITRDASMNEIVSVRCHIPRAQRWVGARPDSTVPWLYPFEGQDDRDMIPQIRTSTPAPFPAHYSAAVKQVCYDLLSRDVSPIVTEYQS